jgi:deoxycytidylate deaminase
MLAAESVALQMAGRSPLRRYKTGAVIVRNTTVVSTGWSHYGMRLSSVYSMHAELHALLRARHLELSDADIFIANMRPGTNRIVMSQPCATCVAALRTVGITRAHYTVESTTETPIFASMDLTASVNLKVYKRPYAACH